MSDPLADPRAHELLGTRSDELAQLAAAFTRIADQSQDAVGSLGRIADAPNWSGDAYDAMRSNIASAQPHLTLIGHAYRQSSAALARYHDVVTEVQPRFRALAQRLSDLTARIDHLGGVYRHQHHVQLSAAQSELTDLQAQGMRMLEEFSDSRDRAGAQVVDVAQQIPTGSSGQRSLGGITNGMGVSGVGAGIAAGAGARAGSNRVEPISEPGHAKARGLANLGSVVVETGVAADGDSGGEVITVDGNQITETPIGYKPGTSGSGTITLNPNGSTLTVINPNPRSDHAGDPGRHSDSGGGVITIG
jgi:hypothetical protein